MNNTYKTPLLVTGNLTPTGTQDVNIISPIPVPVTSSTDTATTSTTSRVNSSTSSHLLVAANPNRKGLLFYNDSAAYQYVKFGINAGLTDFAVRLVPQVFYEVAAPIYVGQIDVISSNTNGAIQVTELS